MKLFCLICICLLVMSSPVFAKEPIRVLEGLVVKVSDGDTITVYSSGTKLKVRLYGIDAPEMVKKNRKNGQISKQGQPYGEEAYRALDRKVYQQKVRLDTIDVDRYRRLVSMVWMVNRNINLEMMREGWAWAYRKYLDSAYASEFLGEEEQTRKKRIGLWRQYIPQPPWEFRKLQRMEKTGW